MDRYDMTFEEAQAYIEKRGLDYAWNDDDVFIDDMFLTQSVGNVLRWADDHPSKETNEKSLQKMLDVARCQKEETINKAVDWLTENLCKKTAVICAGAVNISFNGVIEDFKKYMEGN